MIYELKYEQNDKYNTNNKNDKFISLWEEEEKAKENAIEKQIEEELGFTNYIKYLSSKSLPLIGHNIYFDLMFIYDKFISDLPPDFYTYKTSLHKAFFNRLLKSHKITNYFKTTRHFNTKKHATFLKDCVIMLILFAAINAYGCGLNGSRPNWTSSPWAYSPFS